MYSICKKKSIWQDAGIRTLVAAITARCATNELHIHPNELRFFSLVRGKLRPYFIEQLPASVRTSLLEDTAAFLLHKSSVSGRSKVKGQGLWERCGAGEVEINCFVEPEP